MYVVLQSYAIGDCFKFECKDTTFFAYMQVFRKKSVGKVYFGDKNGDF